MSMLPTHKKIKKILIANRSEIALRIQATCHAMGIETVAIYAPQDAYSRYVTQAGQAFPLSKHGFNAYLQHDEILAIAHEALVDAIHPGYGFLSENAQFAQKVIDAGFLWIGPSPESIRSMGDKVVARNIAQAAGVPVIPGDVIYLEKEGHCEQGLSLAQQIGFPVIIKDPLAGGGKAMRRVDNKDSFAESWRAVASEASRLTGSRHILIEKYLTNCRHIEIQIAGDGEHAIHFFERECSIQRRHQKIVEEAPCAFLPRSLIQQMSKVAILLAESVHYKSLGTVEFVVLEDHSFYFLEMNTRLQVEHSVTEMTTGTDLVALQIIVAEHNKLPYEQENITQTGYAIECRIYAEDPQHNFSPSTGTIKHINIPQGAYIRIDHDLAQNYAITPLFDPMIAKITTYGLSRAAAIGHMQHTLKTSSIHGILTNMHFLYNIITHPIFHQGNYSTQTLQQKDLLDQLITPEQPSNETLLAAALAVVLVHDKQREQQEHHQQTMQQHQSEHHQKKEQESHSWWRMQQWK